MFLFFLNNFWIIFGNFGLISKSVRVINSSSEAACYDCKTVFCESSRASSSPHHEANPPDGGPGVDNCNRHPL